MYSYLSFFNLIFLSISLVPLSPQHENENLRKKIEEMIEEKKDVWDLKGNGLKLSEDDMEIVVHYLLPNEKVSNIVFVFYY
jgi:hypothetical protein